MKAAAALALVLSACGGASPASTASIAPEAGADASAHPERLECGADRFALGPVDVGEVRLQVACWGSGRTAVLLHGYPEFHLTWTRVASILSAHGFRLVAPDQRGYAASDRPTTVDAYSIDHLVADVVGLIRAVSDERVLLVAHDWGGTVAWTVAHQHPELLSGLVIMDGPHPDIWGHPEVDPVQDKATSGYMPLIATQAIGPEVIESQILPFLAPGEIDEYRAAWSLPGAKTSMASWYSANIYPNNVMPTGSSTAVPTLVFWGMKDPYCTPSELEHLGSFVADLEVEQLPEGGHWVPLESADTVAPRIVDFASRLR